MALAYERIVCGLAPLSADKYEEKKVPIYFAHVVSLLLHDRDGWENIF